ncbi:MAG: ATP-binding cassette domain-containing protein [Chloroflexi bacterium]|nr:ATP-binding cassette domain-containing protein [Anaerolineaceae bacterium]NMB89049.1 ATP-binding cassette domain-containing protein [Chloroflexota bacterium]
MKALEDVSFDLRAGEVHALIGENGAGKSTLMKILSGSYTLDKGEVILNGKPVHFANSNQARMAGISIIHQELNLVQQMNAAQNIFLGINSGASKFGVLNKKTRKQLARQMLDNLCVDIDINVPVSRLSVAQQQMIEIAKALSIDSNIIVMDEPTSSLTEREIETLYGVIASLKERGVAVIYISHRLEEIFDLADRVTVLRDGHNVDTVDVKDITLDDLVCMMVGRELKRFFYRERPGSAEWSQLLAKQLTTKILEDHPDVKGIYATNDTMALGTLEALQELGKAGQVMVIGTDGTTGAMDMIRQGKLAATIATFPYDYGWIGLELAIRALEGDKLPKRIDWPTALLTPNNINYYYPDSKVGSVRGKVSFSTCEDELGPLPMPSRSYTIGVILKTFRNEHWRLMCAGYEAAARHYGVTLKIVNADSESDLEQQLEVAQGLLDEGIDALCVSPMTSQNLTPALISFSERKIPIINVDDAQVLETPVTAFISADQRTVGSLAARYLAQQKIPPGSKVAIVEGKAGSHAAQMRKLGFCETAEVSGFTCVTAQKNALEVKNLSTKNRRVKDVSFKARWGEIFGICGLVGAGRTELVRAIFGADAIEGGEICIDDKPVKIRSAKDAIHNKIGFVTEDRKGQGLVLGMPVNKNMTLTILDKITRAGVINMRQRSQIANEYVQRLSIKTPSLNQTVKYLSGGNQQKVVLAKWLATQAKILIFDEPTRGIDVGAKLEVRELINELVKTGACVILISSEMPELIGISDRIMVMHEGEVMGEFDPLSTCEEELLHYASGLTTEFQYNKSGRMLE